MTSLSPQGGQIDNFCAYNQTGQRFISNAVDVPPASTNSYEDLLSNLVPGSASAIWIVPIRNLNATGFRVPVDLLYLDEDCVVLEAVQSFPLARVSMPTSKAASILALPARTIIATGTEAGDRLLISNPDVMQRYLLEANLSHPDYSRKDQHFPVQSILPLWEPPVEEEDALQEQGLDQHKQVQPSTDTPVVSELHNLAPQETPILREAESTTAAAFQLPEHRKPAKLKWWQKLMGEEPQDPRKAQREALPGMVAYFFTGGRPVPQVVGNISISGMYVLTSERWYLGTVVRMTLADERQRSAERSITLQAKVVRCTDDGVGLQFMFPSTKKDVRHNPAEIHAAHLDFADGASAEQLEEFLYRFKAGH